MIAIRTLDLYVVVAATLLFYAIRVIARRRRYPLPPGPAGYPLVGNMFDDFGERRWIAYRELSNNYKSDIVHLNMAGTHMVIVNSRAAALNLFEKRSSIYSDRPRFIMGNELSGLGWNFGFQGYGSSWRERRQLFHTTFQPPALLEYYPEILANSRILLQQFLDRPADFMQHIRYMTARIIMSTAYGLDIQPTNDSYVELAERGMEAMALVGRPGVYLVDSLPWLRYIPKWFPGANFKRDAEQYREDITAMPDVALDFTKQCMAKGIARPSIGSKKLQEMEDDGSWSPKKELALRDVLGIMYMAGLDTTVSALGTFVLAMTVYANVQKKAKAVVDATIGSSRLPDISDRGSMPYIDAVLYEVLRWQLVVPLGVSHASSEDDVYNGYFIPKGSIVVGNSWAILHDKDTYGEDTGSFRPERFMKGDTLDPDVPSPDAAFGFGRRICAGKDSAEATLWISIVSLLAVFDFRGKEGMTENDFGAYTFGVVSRPPDFDCEIKPRSAHAAALVNESRHV